MKCPFAFSFLIWQLQVLSHWPDENRHVYPLQAKPDPLLDAPCKNNLANLGTSFHRSLGAGRIHICRCMHRIYKMQSEPTSHSVLKDGANSEQFSRSCDQC